MDLLENQLGARVGTGLADGQFAIGDTVWGDHTALIIEDGEMPLPEVRDEDAVNALGHGGVPGRDRLGMATWSWEVATDAQNGREALDLFDRLAHEWRKPLQMEPGDLMELRYRIFGRSRRVYGRPRRIAPPKPNFLTSLGQGRGGMDFVLHDPFTYDDTEHSLILDRLAPIADGTVLPAQIPFVVGTMPGEQWGAIDVGGTAPASFTVTFVGPVVNPSLEGANFLIALDTTLDVGQTVTVDTRVGTIKESGQNVRGMLRRGSRLRARLQPVTQTVSFKGTDSTNTSRAVLSWRPAYHSI